MIRIMKGPAGCGKTTSLYRAVINSSIKDTKKNFLVIVPEQFTIETQKKLIMMHPNKGILNIDVLSFERLAHRIFDEAGGEASEIIDDTGKNLIIRQIAAEHADEFRVLRGNLKKNGYISEIKSVISEFIQYDIDSEKIGQMIELSSVSSPYLSYKLSDIKIIYDVFRSRMGKEYITKEELLGKACRSAQKAGFLRNSSLVFDGFTGFTPVQYRFIEKLNELSGDITVTVIDDQLQDGSLFSLGRKTMRHLGEIAKDGVVTEDVNPGVNMRLKDSPELSFLEKNLFRSRHGIYSADTGESIFLSAADGPASETRYVCAAITRLVRENNYRYRDIAVIMGSTDIYSGILKTETERYDIPVFIDNTSGISLNPFTELIRSALAIIREDFSYESVFHFLRTGLTGIDEEVTDEAENYVRALGIRGKKKYSAEWNTLYKGITEKICISAETVRKNLMNIIDPLMDLEGKHTAVCFTRSLYDFIIGISAEDKLREYADRFEKNDKDISKAAEYRQIYALIMQLFDRIADLLPDAEMDIDEYAQILDAGFEEIRVGTVPPDNDCVMAGDLTRSRFGEIKALFFIGMTEGNIPADVSKGGILSDMDRQILEEGKFELAPTAHEKADTERLYFYMNVTKPGERLYLSYPMVSSDGRAERPSYFFNIIKKMFPSCKLKKIEDKETDRKFYTEYNALSLLSSEISSGNNEAVEIYRQLIKRSGYRELLEKMLDASFGSREGDRLSAAAAKAVYGGNPIESATELEKYAACAYSHFLQYGLHLRERYDFEFEARDLGTVLHNLLKDYADMLSKESLNFRTVEDTESDRLIEKAVSHIRDDRAALVLGSSARNSYMLKRLQRIAKRTVDTLRFQIKQGSFVPSSFEQKFEYDGLKGYIDRMDRVSDGQDIYIDIIDYKSGNKEFDMNRIYYGLDLQLIIYLSAGMDIEIRQNPGKNIHPAGIFYYHIDDPVIDSEDSDGDTSVLDIMHKKLKLKGIVNNDARTIQLLDGSLGGKSMKSDIIPVGYNKDSGFDAASSVAAEEDFRNMMKYAETAAGHFRKDITGGDVKKSPYEYKDRTACDYCAYSSICSGGEKRRLKEVKMPDAFRGQII